MGKMREILFRGRDSEGIWHEGIPVHDDDTWYLPNDFGSPKAYSINPDTLCEYTGLTNDVGVRIFENDIIEITTLDKHEKRRAVVRFGEYDCDGIDSHIGWYLEYKGYKYPFGELKEIIANGVYASVIGNVYDNPELMEEEK